MALEDDLVRRATKLCSRLRPPVPDPREIYTEVVRRLLQRYRDGEVESTRKVAFTILARLVCDVARGYRFDAGVGAVDDADGEDAAIDPGRSPFAPVTPASGELRVDVASAMARLSAEERCLLLRAAIEDHPVHDACRLCGIETKSPHHVYQKLLAKLRELLEEYRP